MVSSQRRACSHPHLQVRGVQVGMGGTAGAKAVGNHTYKGGGGRGEEGTGARVKTAATQHV